MNRQLIMGSFDSERYWASPERAVLPSLPDHESGRIVLAMDELLFLLCRPEDQLVTRLAMDERHLAYLYELGFLFRASTSNADSDPAKLFQQETDLFRLLADTDQGGYFRNFLDGSSELIPFAAVDAIEDFCGKYNIQSHIPPMECIKQVNSKFYSAGLYKDVSENYQYSIVGSSDELISVGQELLHTSAVMIKDEYGVSGKGNLVADSEKILLRIADYLRRQESSGREVRFIVEPLLDKDLDFSCQFFITPEGEYRFISVQKLLNHHFSYLGSFPADEAFMQLLERSGYFGTMRTVASRLYGNGYFGHVCIDSMLLKNGAIVEVVEINARHSMSLIKHHLDRFLSKYGVDSYMTHLTLNVPEHADFTGLLAALQAEDILFHPHNPRGVIPLSSNTLFLNRRLNPDKAYAKGRLYLGVAGEKQGEIIAQAKSRIEQLGFRII